MWQVARQLIDSIRRLTLTGKMILALILASVFLFALAIYGLISGYYLLMYGAYCLISLMVGLLGLVFLVRADLRMPQGGWRNPEKITPWYSGYCALLGALVFLPQGLLSLAFPYISFELRFTILETDYGIVLGALLIGFLVTYIHKWWLARRGAIATAETSDAATGVSQPAGTTPPHVSRRTLLVSAGVLGLEVFGVSWLISRLPAFISLRSFRTAKNLFGDFVAWAPDGRRLAAPISDSAVAVWDVATGATLQQLSTGIGMIGNLAWSPKGDQLAVGGDTVQGSVVQLWNVSSGRLTLSRSVPTTLRLNVGWTPFWHGEQVWVVTSFYENDSNHEVAYVWDVTSNTTRKLFTAQNIPSIMIPEATSQGTTSLVSVSPSGRLLHGRRSLPAPFYREVNLMAYNVWHGRLMVGALQSVWHIIAR